MIFENRESITIRTCRLESRVSSQISVISSSRVILLSVCRAINLTVLSIKIWITQKRAAFAVLQLFNETAAEVWRVKGAVQNSTRLFLPESYFVEPEAVVGLAKQSSHKNLPNERFVIYLSRKPSIIYEKPVAALRLFGKLDFLTITDQAHR